MQISVQSSQSFLSWTEAVWEANTELGITGSDYHIAEDKLCAHFVPRLSVVLKGSYNASNTHGTLDAITDLKAWIQCIHLLDVENQNKREEWVKIAQAAAHTNMKMTCTNTGTSGSNTPSSSTSTPVVLSNTTNTRQTFTAKLTQAEHNLLRAHRGCFCCRLFYANHFAPDCPLGTKGRPTPEACKNVTLTEALKAKAAFEVAGTTVVAGIFEAESDDSFEMSENKASKYVTKPLLLPSHLWWDCCLDAPLPCAPTPM